ncbi:MAG: lysoplasmalogenase [Candidatus Marinimicrobia bacterium]|nr:lysoplasmalogenase [Candidatus Neomarinimicrobiota bacterium]
MFIIILLILTLISTAIHIRAEYAGPRILVYIFKPLMTILIILIAVIQPGSQPDIYRYAIITGLVFSLAGDIFLMFPDTRFLSGLVSFLIAHLAYIFAFTWGIGFGLTLYIALPLVVVGGQMFRYLSPGLGKMKLPVLVYLAAIIVMAWQGWEHWEINVQWYTMLAAIGALFFVVSDSLIAINRFRFQFKSARAWVLVTYMIAQLLIAFSV